MGTWDRGQAWLWGPPNVSHLGIIIPDQRHPPEAPHHMHGQDPGLGSAGWCRVEASSELNDAALTPPPPSLSLSLPLSPSLPPSLSLSLSLSILL